MSISCKLYDYIAPKLSFRFVPLRNHLNNDINYRIMGSWYYWQFYQAILTHTPTVETVELIFVVVVVVAVIFVY